MNATDRIEKLLTQTVVTGIDFIYIYPGQVLMDIYFFLDPATLDDPLSNNLGEIKIYSPSGAAVPIAVSNLGLINVGSTHVLRLQAAQPGNFALYNLLIEDSRIDPYYNDVAFSFKANCPSELDCKPHDHECPFEEPVDFPIDYTARDFWSYRRALLEFASLRYPSWPDRLAADAGVMLAEVMSAAGDEMAYYQDRIGREAYLETGTQRRSIRRHARLVDYHIHENLGAFAWIDMTIKGGMSGNIPAGSNVWAFGENNVRVDFEIGKNLEENIAGKQYSVKWQSNEFETYRWDEDQVCLPVGTTDMYLNGFHQANLLNFFGFPPSRNEGKWVLLLTKPTNPAQPSRSFMVRLISVTELTDPVFNRPITHIIWGEEQALPFEMDMAILFVHGNLLPSTAGKTFSQYLITGASLDELTVAEKNALQSQAAVGNAEILQAIERVGSNNSVCYLSTLTGSEQSNMVWLGNNPETAMPEIHMEQLRFSSPDWVSKKKWDWRAALVGIHSSEGLDTDYTLDDGSWRRVVGYWRKGKEIIHQDYASGNGTTIRFGDNEFGITPAEKSVFRVHYRLGGGWLSNVAPGVLNNIDFATFDFIESITNPLNAVNGKNQQALNHIRQSAPEAFRSITYRAVRPEDYAEAAERLSWVQKAGAAFRWTGSWLTAFVTPDPKNAVALTDVWRKELFDQLNRFRQAGREAYIMEPQYADLDLEIEVCALPDCYPGELKERLSIKLFGRKGVIPVKGFFSPDRFTFGDLLERSQLEAAIQEVPGVKAVENIRYRRRGIFGWKNFDEYSYDPGKDSIIRVENDVLHPERGTLKIHIHGGA